MKFRKLEKHYMIRFEKGEEIATELQRFCEKEKLYLGKIEAIGAVDKVVIGFFDTVKNEYMTRTISGDHEIVSLIGNLTEMGGNPYLHMHITLADRDYNVRGGHLTEAYVSATCEMVLTTLEGNVTRRRDEVSGLNLLDI